MSSDAAPEPDARAAEQPRALVHGLRWGLKSSFIDYVRRMPDGKGSVGDGASPVGAGELFYALDAEASSWSSDSSSSTMSARRAVWAFRGDVRFSGHYGMLFVRVANPRLELDGPSGLLTIEDPQARPDAPRVPLVTLSLQHVASQDGTEVWGSDDVALTAAGVELFNDVYAEGEPFEPLVVQLPIGTGRAG